MDGDHQVKAPAQDTFPGSFQASGAVFVSCATARAFGKIKMTSAANKKRRPRAIPRVRVELAGNTPEFSAQRTLLILRPPRLSILTALQSHVQRKPLN